MPDSTLPRRDDRRFPVGWTQPKSWGAVDAAAGLRVVFPRRDALIADSRDVGPPSTRMDWRECLEWHKSDGGIMAILESGGRIHVSGLAMLQVPETEHRGG